LYFAQAKLSGRSIRFVAPGNIAAIPHADSTDEMQHSHLFPGSSGAPLPERLGQPLSLWGSWWNAIQSLRPAFSRLRAFMWFATIVAGMTVRTELLGVTSIVRALNLRPNLYNLLRKHFHSSAVKLDRLSALWVQAVLRLFPSPVSVNGRLVLVADGIKAPKRGKKMPAVKLLHQQSESNTKPEYIMGHSMQAISLLVTAAESVFAVPLAARIHEGVVWCNADKRTLLDKMLGLLGILNIGAPCYFVADAYYAAGKIVKGLLKQGHHLVTRVKSNAVAYAPAGQKKGRRKRGGVQGLWQKDKAQVSVVEYWIDAGGCQSRLRRAQRHPSLSCLRSIVASSGVARPFCGRHSSHQGRLPLDVYRYLPVCHRDHSYLWTALQDRTLLQTGHAPDRYICLSFLDARHDPFALPQR